MIPQYYLFKKGVLMWFSKFLRMMRFHKIAKDVAQLPEHKPAREVCEELFVELNAKQFNEYDPFVGMCKLFTPLYPNIDAYTTKLKELNRLIKQGKPIPNDWYGENVAMEVSVDRFMVSADGYHVDVTHEVSLFKEAGINLCVLLKEADTETYGMQEHNLRVLTKLFVNLRAVTLVLMNVSLTKNA